MVTNFVRLREGLIPTYAGNTHVPFRRSTRQRAHPHVCGEHEELAVHCLVEPGSSPRMRGTRLVLLRRGIAVGLIPTYAGNTTFCLCAVHCRWAHPHVCGEHMRRTCIVPCITGSSPRMRGTRRSFLFSVGVGGLIPTYAGNTWCFLLFSGHGRAHPHVCGEHCLCHCVYRIVMGSSPRMRGTQNQGEQIAAEVGLIPTYAGNTSPSVCNAVGARAHPHVCGEHCGVGGAGGWFGGSSPRMRGTPDSAA